MRHVDLRSLLQSAGCSVVACRIEPRPPAWGVQSLSHWAIKEVPDALWTWRYNLSELCFIISRPDAPGSCKTMGDAKSRLGLVFTLHSLRGALFLQHSFLCLNPWLRGPPAGRPHRPPGCARCPHPQLLHPWMTLCCMLRAGCRARSPRFLSPQTWAHTVR